MNVNSVPAVITAVTSILLGCFVYLRGRKLLPNRLWAILSLFMALWSFSMVLTMNAANERVASWWIRMLYFGAIPLPAILLHFTLSYVQAAHKKE